MATRTETTRETANEAASEASRTTSEASRTTSEASRRTLLSGQDAIQTARTYLEESIEANRKLFNAYAQGIEVALRGSFEVQNAVFAAGMSFLDASANSSRNVAQQWTEAMHEAQQAMLGAWQAGVGAGDGLLARASSDEISGQEDKGRKR